MIAKAPRSISKAILTLKPGFYDISELLRTHWPRMTEEEIALYKKDRQKFCDAVMHEYHLSQEEVDMQLDLMKRQALFAA